MSTAAAKSYAEQQTQAIAQIANTSRLLRDAISAAIPVAPEQYLTIAIPGTSIDTRDISDGGTFVWDAKDSAFTPNQVLQAEGKLVDNMIPLSYVMVGNTGKSVARSYSRALDYLVARKATVSTGKGTSGEQEIRSPGDPSYDHAMHYLTSPIKDGLTPVDFYVQKQDAWKEAQDAWDTAKLKAKEDAIKRFPQSPVLQNQDYNEWNQAHYRKYKFQVQGRYIDWVTNGYKFNVEQNFGVVDVDSIMARLEQSKESIRNSVVVDADGSNEVNLVTLTPKNWATLCKKKEEGWYTKNGTYSLEQLEAEIDRLGRLKTSYLAMGEAMGFTFLNGSITGRDPKKIAYPVSSEENDTAPDVTTADNDVKEKFTELYKAQGAYAKEETAKETEKEPNPKEADLNKARADLAAAIEAQQGQHLKYTKWAITNMKDQATEGAIQAWLEQTLKRLDDNITSLEKKKALKLQSQPPVPPAIANATAKEKDDPDGVNGTTNVQKGDEEIKEMFEATPKQPDTSPSTTPQAGPKNAGNDPQPQVGSSSDPWTTISASFSASDQQSTSTTSSWGMSVGGSVGWGGFSAGGSYAHEQSKSDFTGDMASCDVSVSFSCLVVNIGRPWLYGEIFADAELSTATGIKLSPGAEKLKSWIQGQKGKTADVKSNDQTCIENLQDYSMFPAYPTSFIVAADTTIEFHGNTQHIEKHFSAQSSSGSASIGWGPFSVSSSFHHSSSKQSFQCQTTATGCRLTFGAPQVIGWVSQILPPLPRPLKYEPMLQNDGADNSENT